MLYTGGWGRKKRRMRHSYCFSGGVERLEGVEIGGGSSEREEGVDRET